MIKALVGGLVALVLGVSPAWAKGLFKEEAPLKITITAPFPALVRSAKSSLKAYPASLSVTEGGAQPQTLAIQLSPRGYSRRASGYDYCEFPPLLLTFDKTTTHGTLFQGQHKLKLVTYCRAPADYQPHIVLEYLAYRLYNLLTPMSYRVRAAEVTYRDSEADPGLTRFGFVIEDISSVAGRNDRERLKVASHQIAASQLDAHATARVALFEYMIGNLDWEFLASAPGVPCCHNIRLIAAPDATPATASAVVPAPYDFDLTGLVDPPYAETPAEVPVERITERYYRGFCSTSGEIPSVADEYRAHRAEMMALIDNDPRLTPAFRAKTDRFLNDFFAVLDDPARLERQVIRHCR